MAEDKRLQYAVNVGKYLKNQKIIFLNVSYCTETLEKITQ